MSFIERLTRDPIVLIFTLLSLMNFVYGLRLLGVVRSRWPELKSPVVQPWQKQLAERAAFLVAVPPGVLVHEFGHALATWLFGGRILEFGYGFYWGYVLPVGDFSPAQFWTISIAGTLGTLLYALALWQVLGSHRFAPIRYFALRALRFHLYYALIYYPLFTLFTFIGDWRIIYDFEATPLLSGLTGLLHLGSLALFWRADRHGRFEMVAYGSAEDQVRMAELERQAAAAPHDLQLQLKLVDALRLGGATKRALHLVRGLVAQNPEFADGHLQLALLLTQNKREVPPQARKSAERAVRLGLSRPAALAAAHQIVGRYSLDTGKADQAVDHFSQGLASLRSAEPPANVAAARLHYLRALAYRRQRQYDSAVQDIEKAIRLAGENGDEAAENYYKSELETIRSHAGGRLNS